MWLSGLSAGLRTKGSLVWFPVRAHTWVAGQVPSWGHIRGNHTLISPPSLLPFCHPSILPTFKNFLKILFIHLLERGEGREKGREGSVYGCLSHAPNWGPGLQPRHVPWPGIEPATLQFVGRCSIHWDTLARETVAFLKNIKISSKKKRNKE